MTNWDDWEAQRNQFYGMRRLRWWEPRFWLALLRPAVDEQED